METWLLLLGLALTGLGAGVAAWNVILSPATAAELASTYWDKNERLEASLMRQSHGAAIGLGLVTAGTLLQIAGTALSLLR